MFVFVEQDRRITRAWVAQARRLLLSIGFADRKLPGDGGPSALRRPEAPERFLRCTEKEVVRGSRWLGSGEVPL
jgi:hypothetical protein